MMVLMEDPGMVLHPVDGDATERLWVEVRQLNLYFRKSLWCHIFNGGVEWGGGSCIMKISLFLDIPQE